MCAKKIILSGTVSELDAVWYAPVWKKLTYTYLLFLWRRLTMKVYQQSTLAAEKRNFWRRLLSRFVKYVFLRTIMYILNSHQKGRKVESDNLLG